MNANRLPLITLSLGGLTGLSLGAIYFLSKNASNTEFVSVVALVAGGLLMAFFDALKNLMEERSQPAPITFNVDEVLKDLESLPRASTTSQRSESAWAMDVVELAERDSALALAKVRMDIEQELRLIAVQRLDAPPHLLKSSRQIARMLVDKKILEPHIQAPLEDVLIVANHAIHGNPVSKSVAISSVRIGEALTDYLRSFSQPTEPHNP